LRTGAIIGLILLLIVVFVIGGFAGWVFASAKSSATGTTTTTTTQAATTLDAVRESVAAKVRPSIVEVYVTLAKGAALGSGVIVNSQGYIVTNNHVVSGALSIQVVLSNGTKEPAQLAGADAAYDLAVLKIAVPKGGLSVATLGDSTQLKVGQEVLVIGNPLGITQTVTNGIVSALKRSVSEGQGAPTIQNAIQTDAPINPGNSGGALVDLQGNVVGIPTLTAIDPEFNTPANGVGFAIPVNRVKTILPQFIQTGSSS
jgi:S1-C subfamily serine protease